MSTEKAWIRRARGGELEKERAEEERKGRGDAAYVNHKTIHTGSGTVINQ